jgi:hypothetical protein
VVGVGIVDGEVQKGMAMTVVAEEDGDVEAGSGGDGEEEGEA